MGLSPLYSQTLFTRTAALPELPWDFLDENGVLQVGFYSSEVRAMSVSIRELVLLVCGLTHAIPVAEVVRIGGVVKDMGGTPIEKATVSLVGMELHDTTDSQGKYQFLGGTNTSGLIRDCPAEPTAFLWAPRKLSLNVPTRSEFGLTLYDLSGKVLFSLKKRPMIPGKHAIGLPSSATVSVARVAHETGTYTTRMIRELHGRQSTLFGSTESRRSFQKLAANAVDTIVVVHPSYHEKHVPVLNYVDQIDVTLESDSIPKNVGIFLLCESGIGDCGVSCSPQYYNLVIAGTNMDTVRATGISTDTLRLFVPPGRSRLFRAEVFCERGGVRKEVVAAADIPEGAFTVVSMDLAVTDDTLRLLYPRGGESYELGDTVGVTWCNGSTQGTGEIELRVSTDEGQTYGAMVGHTFERAQSSFDWVIGPEFAGKQFLIRIADYSQSSIMDEMDRPSYVAP